MAVALTLGAWIGWFGFARVTLRAVSSQARLVLDRSVYPVQTAVAGQVLSTRLALGEAVAEGAVLVEIEATAQLLELDEAHARLESVNEQLAALRRRLAAKEQALDDLRDSGVAALEEARSQYSQLKIKAELAVEESKHLGRLRDLGGGSELEMVKAELEARRTQVAVEGHHFVLERMKFDQRRLESDRTAENEELKQELERYQGETLTLSAAARRLEYEVERRKVRAPARGEIGEIAEIVPGIFLEAGQRLGAVVSQGDLAVVADFHSSDALGRLFPGQVGRIRFDGFPWSRFGTLGVRVESVSQEARAGFIRVEFSVSTSSESVIPLQHGMTGTVEVDVERVSPAELLLRAAGKMIASSSPATDAPALAQESR